MPTLSKVRMLTTSVLGMIITIGIARFAYTPMIPEMMEEIGLSESVAGYLAAANYAGYLSGALLISFISNLKLKQILFRSGLCGAVITTLLMAFTQNEIIWYLLRFISGLSSSAGVLLGAGLLMHWLMKHKHQAELGIFFSGLGLGIVITALIAELIKDHFSWDQQWLIYGSVGLVLTLPVWRWFPDQSEDSIRPATNTSAQSVSGLFMPVLQTAYFCAGVGYVITATFLVAIAESSDTLRGQGWLIWLVVGLACAPGCGLWDRFARIYGQWLALFLAYVLNSVSILLLMISQELSITLLSAVIYGGSFIGIVSMTLSMVGRLYPHNPSRPMSRLTFSYGLAQMIAPAIVGYLAEMNGNYYSGLLMTLLVMTAGIIALLWAMQLAKTTRHHSNQSTTLKGTP